MTHTDSEEDDGTAIEDDIQSSEELRDRLDRLETLVEEQRQVFETQRSKLAELAGAEERRDGKGRDDTSPSTTRRGALTAGGVLALLGLGVGQASAEPQGQVGTSSDPLVWLFTREVNSGAGGTLTFNTGGTRALFLGNTTQGYAGNVVAGLPSNAATNGARGATISGGGYDGMSHEPNVVSEDHATISGGYGNVVDGIQSTVGGAFNMP